MARSSVPVQSALDFERPELNLADLSVTPLKRMADTAQTRLPAGALNRDGLRFGMFGAQRLAIFLHCAVMERSPSSIPGTCWT